MDKEQTLQLHYKTWACACANWATTEDMYQYKDTGYLSEHGVFTEPASPELTLPDTLQYNGDVVEFTGQFYPGKRLPEGYVKGAETAEPARVFRYSSYKVIKSNYDKVIGYLDPGSMNKNFDELFTDWIHNLIVTENPGPKIIAYNFGIDKTIQGVYGIHLIGAKKYDAKNDDWAADMGDYQPENDYLMIPIKAFKGLTDDEVLERVEKQVKEFTQSEAFKNSFFKPARAITVGFDEGDLNRIK